MNVTVQYETLLKRAAGTASDEIDVDGACDVRAAIQAVADRRRETLASLLLAEDGDVRSSVLIFVGDRQISPGESHQLQDGDIVTLMTPISGG